MRPSMVVKASMPSKVWVRERRVEEGWMENNGKEGSEHDGLNILEADMCCVI